jgi:hypothetical protein
MIDRVWAPLDSSYVCIDWMPRKEEIVDRDRLCTIKPLTVATRGGEKENKGSKNFIYMKDLPTSQI